MTLTGESGASVPSIALNDENTMPALGLGVAELSDDETERAVSAALEMGYRLIDTAAVYGNEAAVGRAIAASGIPRAELFVTTKLANADQGFTAAQNACKASLERLGLDYVDLYLIHWPAPQLGQYVDSFGGLIQSRGDGLTRSIGVCNFTDGQLADGDRSGLRHPRGQPDRAAPAAQPGRAARGQRRSTTWSPRPTARWRSAGCWITRR